jgi:hypothetical protein
LYNIMDSLWSISIHYCNTSYKYKSNEYLNNSFFFLEINDKHSKLILNNASEFKLLYYF